MPRRGRDGKWKYLPLAGAIKDAGIVRVRTSVLRRQNTVGQFVATRPIPALCEGTEQRGGDTGPPKMVGADGNILENGAGAERKRGGGGQRDGNSHCRDGNNDAGDVVIGFRNGIGGEEEEEESLGASGSSGEERSGAGRRRRSKKPYTYS